MVKGEAEAGAKYVPQEVSEAAAMLVAMAAVRQAHRCATQTPACHWAAQARLRLVAASGEWGRWLSGRRATPAFGTPCSSSSRGMYAPHSTRTDHSQAAQQRTNHMSAPTQAGERRACKRACALN